MTFKNTITSVVISVCVLLITASCSSTRVYYPSGRSVGHGPPPHAPAHGYRRKQVCGVEVVFDTQLGVYVVVGYPGYYFYDGYFYRLTDDVWEMSLKFDGGWILTAEKPLPPGLRGIHMKSNGNGKSRNHGKNIAKGNGKHKGR